MVAINKKSLQQQPLEIEALLPWHAAGTLGARDSRVVEQALARDPVLAEKYAAIVEEHAEIVALNEGLGAPSARVVQKLFAAIDAEPAETPLVSGRIGGFLASQSPRTLAWSAAALTLLVPLLAGMTGAFVATRPGLVSTASSGPEAVRHSSQLQAPPRALVRFVPDARVSDITAFLESSQATVIGTAAGGMFRLEFGDKPMSRQETARLSDRLRNEKIIDLATPAQ
jgi:hypothetical protein